MSYNYPISDIWSKEEIIEVVNFYTMVEKAYESGISREEIMLAYTRFKQIVPSKSEEKQIGDTFEKESGYSIYRTIKRAREAEKGEKVRM